MAFYDYKCPSCGKEQEESHGMSETPEIKCEACETVMNKIMKLGSGGFKMTKDSTRKRDYKTRYGGHTKKSDNTMTPTESAQVKAKAQMEERIAKKNKKDSANDPYANFK